jgi:citrate lyase subunit beta/citryl-CoA lyase
MAATYTAQLARTRGVVAPLFVPALEERKLAKARGVAEAVIVDLEDAVPDERKSEARQWVAGIGGPREGLWVRVNAAETGRCMEDIAAAAKVADVIILPKCESAEEIRAADLALTAAAAPTLVIPILETAAGLEAASAIARAAPQRVPRLSLGLGDLSRDLGIAWEPGGVMAQHARCHIAIISRAARLAAPIDSVVPTVGDVQMLTGDTTRARAAGFTGKFCIHPAQLETVRTVFAPSEGEIALARKLVEAFAGAIAQGRAAVVIDGHFVDYPIAELAEALLARAGCASGLLARPTPAP